MAAALLARAGLPVTLIEQTKFPRDKVCGECISADGWDLLERADLTKALIERGATRLNAVTLYAPDGRCIARELPRPNFGLSRKALHVGPSPAGRIRFLSDNSIQTIRGDVILLADGKSALLAPRPRPSGDLGVKGHFVNVRIDGEGGRAGESIHLFSTGQ